MDKGQYKGLLEGTLKGDRAGLFSGLAKGLYGSNKFRKKHIFWCLGNSICAGTAGGAVAAANYPIPGTAFEFERLRSIVVPFGQGFVSGNFAFNTASPWATFSRLYYKHFGISPVIVNRGAGSSTLSTADNANDWQTTGTNWNDAVKALRKCQQLVPGGVVQGVLIGEILINDIQGLNATSGLTVAQIKTNLYDFINRVIAVVGPDVPILFNTPGRATTLVTSAKMSGVRDALISACIDFKNVFIGATLGGFTVGFYYHDDIHPNGNGNDQLGRSFVRWFRNPRIPKWPRSIIAVLDAGGGSEGEIPSRDKDQIVTWLSDPVTLASYLKAEYLYFSMGRFQYGTGYNAAIDWAFRSAPAIYGNFSVGGTYPNYYVATDGVNNQYFDNGNQQNASMVYADNTDAQAGIKITFAGHAIGVAAYAMGASNLYLAQLNPTGTIFNIFGATSDSGPDAKIMPARYVLARGGGNIVLYKDGVAVAGGARANGALGSGRTTVGSLNAGTSRFNGQFTELWLIKNSLVPNLGDWLTALDALMAP